jgi:hypothetical protein
LKGTALLVGLPTLEPLHQSLAALLHGLEFFRRRRRLSLGILKDRDIRVSFETGVAPPCEGSFARLCRHVEQVPQGARRPFRALGDCAFGIIKTRHRREYRFDLRDGGGGTGNGFVGQGQGGFGRIRIRCVEITIVPSLKRSST